MTGDEMTGNKISMIGDEMNRPKMTDKETKETK
jgi:hypothetical protein